MNDIVVIRGVEKTFQRGGHQPVHALCSLDLTITRGDFVMVSGPSGSGKSTLLFAIGGMMQPSAGQVIVGGKDLYAMSGTQRAQVRRKMIGFMFQTFNLVPYLSALENVALPAILLGWKQSKAFEEAERALDRVGLSHRFTHRPAELSVGERQRAALARASIHTPDILIADEPTGNLDRATATQVMQLLKQLNAEGQTVIMATHDDRLFDQGTRHVALRLGSIDQQEIRPAEVACSP